MTYDHNIRSITTKLEDTWKKNEQSLSNFVKEEVDGIKNLIDIQFEIASYFIPFWVTQFTGLRRGYHELLPLMHSLFHRNFFLFYSAVKLTLGGMHLPARPILRNIFEPIMIAKFCHLSEDISVMKRWHCGESVYFTNTILKKIIKPDPEPFFTFWGMICEYSHATKTAIQYSLELKECANIDDLVMNFAIIKALLECNYHFLNSHLITPELNYAAEFYTTRMKDICKPYRIPELRKAAHKQFKKNRNFLGAESIKLITTYKRKWVIKH